MIYYKNLFACYLPSIYLVFLLKTILYCAFGAGGGFIVYWHRCRGDLYRCGIIG